MPIPKDLRLSLDPYFKQLLREDRFKEAAEYAHQLYYDIFGMHPSTDDSKALNPRHERAQFFDTPIDEQGIRRFEMDKRFRQKWGMYGGGMVAQQMFGKPGQVVAEALPTAAKNFFATFGLGDREEYRPGATAAKWVGTGAEIGMGLIPFVGATKLMAAPKIVRALRLAKPGAALFGAGTKGAHTVQASSTLGLAGGLTEMGRQVTVDVMNQLGHTSLKPDYGEVPAAALSFAAGGVPVGRFKAMALQAGASAVGQKVFLGEVDPSRLAMEAIFAGVFGNPQFKELRNRAVIMTPEIAARVEAAHNAKVARTRIDQLYKEGDVATAEYILRLSKYPEDVLRKMQVDSTNVGDEYALRVIRDAIAYKNGDVVIAGPETPSGPNAPGSVPGTTVTGKQTGRKPRQKKSLTIKERVANLLHENPEGLDPVQIADALKLKVPQVQKALKLWDNPHGEGAGSGILQRFGAAPGRKRMRYALTDQVQKDFKPYTVDTQQPLVEEAGKQMDEAQRIADDERASAAAREAAEQKILSLSDFMDTLTGKELDPQNFTGEEGRKRATNLIMEALEGRTKGEIEGWLADASKMPEELRVFRRSVVEAVGKLFRKFPEDELLKAEAEALLPHVTEYEPHTRYTKDIPKDEQAVRNIAAQWDVEVRPEEGGWAVYRRGRKRIGRDGPEEWDKVYEFVNFLARGKTIDPKKYPGLHIEVAIHAGRAKGWSPKHNNGKWAITNEATGEMRRFDSHETAYKFIDELPDNFELSTQRLEKQHEGAESPVTEATDPTTVGRPHEFRYVMEEVTPDRWSVKDNETGETRYFKTKDEAAAWVEENTPADQERAPTTEPVPDDQQNLEPAATEEAPGLSGQRVAGTKVTLVDDAATSRLLPHGYEAPQHPKKGKGEPRIHAPGWWRRATRGIPDLFHTYSDLTGIPLFRRIWDPLNTASNQRNEWMRPFEERLGQMFARVPRYRHHAVTQLLMHEDIKLAAVEYQATQWEMKAAMELRNWYRDVLGLTKEELDRLLHVGLPKLREINGDTAQLEDFTLPGGLAELIPQIQDGTVSMHDDSALGVARDVLHSLGRKRYMAKPEMEAKAVQRELTSRAMRDPKNKPLYDGAAEVVQTYLDTITNRVPEDAAALAEAYGHMGKYLKKLRLIEGDVLTGKDMERLAMMSTSWYGGLAMSARMALVARNFTQSILTLPKVGARNAFLGVKDALWASAAEKQHLFKIGVIGEPAMYDFAATRASRVGSGWIQESGATSWQLARLERSLRSLQATGLWAYRKADQFNRVASFYAGKRALKRAWEKYGADNIEDFYVFSGLAGDSRSFQRDIARMLAKGQVEEAATEYGKHVSRMTQYLYSRQNVPRAFQGMKGRLFGQFGVWPLGFHSYMVEQGGGWHHLFTEPFKMLEAGARKPLSLTGLVDPKRARTAQSRYRTRFAMRMWGMWTVMGLLGSALGIDTSSWNKANPLTLEGGPAWQIVRDGITVAIGSNTEFERSMGRASLTRFAKQALNPMTSAFGAHITDWEEALELYSKNKDYEAILALLGFNLLED